MPFIPALSTNPIFLNPLNSFKEENDCPKLLPYGARQSPAPTLAYRAAPFLTYLLPYLLT